MCFPFTMVSNTQQNTWHVENSQHIFVEWKDGYILSLVSEPVFKIPLFKLQKEPPFFSSPLFFTTFLTAVVFNRNTGVWKIRQSGATWGIRDILSSKSWNKLDLQILAPQNLESRAISDPFLDLQQLSNKNLLNNVHFSQRPRKQLYITLMRKLDKP